MVDAIWPFQGQKQDKGAEIFLCFLKEATEPGCQVICRWWWSSVTLRWVRVYAVIFTPAPVVVFMESFWKSCWQISTMPPTYANWSGSSKEMGAAQILIVSTHLKNNVQHIWALFKHYRNCLPWWKQNLAFSAAQGIEAELFLLNCERLTIASSDQPTT